MPSTVTVMLDDLLVLLHPVGLDPALVAAARSRLEAVAAAAFEDPDPRPGHGRIFDYETV